MTVAMGKTPGHSIVGGQGAGYLPWEPPPTAGPGVPTTLQNII